MRLLFFYLVLVAAQGFLSALLSPLPPPDLFFLAVLTLLWRLSPWQLVAVGYGVGLLQDVFGHGVLGVHALALAAGALAAAGARAQLTGAGMFERMLVVTVGMAGKWVVMVAMLAWLSGTSILWADTAAVATIETLFTVALATLLLPWADALIERTAALRKGLL